MHVVDIVDPALTEMRVLGNSVVQTPDCSFLSSGNRELRISYGIHTVLRKDPKSSKVFPVHFRPSVTRRTNILSWLTMMALQAVAVVMGVGGLTGRGR